MGGKHFKSENIENKCDRKIDAEKGGPLARCGIMPCPLKDYDLGRLPTRKTTKKEN